MVVAPQLRPMRGERELEPVDCGFDPNQKSASRLCRGSDMVLGPAKSKSNVARNSRCRHSPTWRNGTAYSGREQSKVGKAGMSWAKRLDYHRCLTRSGTSRLDQRCHRALE